MIDVTCAYCKKQFSFDAAKTRRRGEVIKFNDKTPANKKQVEYVPNCTHCGKPNIVLHTENR